MSRRLPLKQFVTSVCQHIRTLFFLNALLHILCFTFHVFEFFREQTKGLTCVLFIIYVEKKYMNSRGKIYTRHNKHGVPVNQTNKIHVSMINYFRQEQ